jgi:hypothetical protein
MLEGSWLGSAIAWGETGDDYFCVPISPHRLSQFRHGQLDLRTVLAEPEERRPARTFIPSNGKAQSAILELVPVDAPPDKWLPGPGFLLTTFIEPVAADYREMVSLATSENRPILRLNLNPADGSHAIDMDKLGEALLLFQNGVREAHQLVMQTVPNAIRKALSAPENHIYEALAFAGNSFEVHMRAKANADLFGHTAHISALQKLDEITSVVDNTPAALDVARKNKGHFVSAISELMKFVASADTPLSYAWTAPQSSLVQAHVIRPEPARALYDALVSREELSRKDATFVGVFRKIDEDNGAWRVKTNEGLSIKGQIAAEAKVSLHGLTIGTKQYRIVCREVLLETVGTGKRTPQLEMTSPPEEIEAAT